MIPEPRPTFQASTPGRAVSFSYQFHTGEAPGSQTHAVVFGKSPGCHHSLSLHSVSAERLCQTAGLLLPGHRANSLCSFPRVRQGKDRKLQGQILCCSIWQLESEDLLENTWQVGI